MRLGLYSFHWSHPKDRHYCNNRCPHNFHQLMQGQSLPNEKWVIKDKSASPISLLINSYILQSDVEEYLSLSAIDITNQKPNPIQT